jgi:ribonuclease BN (tRNA processing enzyme)
MRLVVVGSGTAAPEPERVCSAYYLETADARLLMDCGPGAVHHLARFGLPWNRLDHLLLSHFHNDHVGDVPTLLFALKWGTAEPRVRPLHLWGPRGLHHRLDRMADAFGTHVSDPGFPLDVHELDPGSTAQLGDGLTLYCAATPHTEGSLAFRIEAQGGARIGYTGDTGPSDEVARFLAGVDLMIAECSVPDDQAMETHLTPSRLAAMALVARPRRLMPTHVYPALARLDLPALLRDAGWDGETVLATDGLSLEL